MVLVQRSGSHAARGGIILLPELARKSGELLHAVRPPEQVPAGRSFPRKSGLPRGVLLHRSQGVLTWGALEPSPSLLNIRRLRDQDRPRLRRGTVVVRGGRHGPRRGRNSPRDKVRERVVHACREELARDRGADESLVGGDVRAKLHVHIGSDIDGPADAHRGPTQLRLNSLVSYHNTDRPKVGNISEKKKKKNRKPKLDVCLLQDIYKCIFSVCLSVRQVLFID